MTYRRVVLTAGFAMFSMFFGSGNLVFPLLIGKNTLDQSFYSTIGLIVTAVVVPFLGLFGMILYKGNTREYFRGLGKIPSFILILMILSLIGPFGVVPRCITVAFGGLNVLYPEMPFAWFSFGFCALVTALIWRPNQVVDIIGLLLTPLKLGGLLFLMMVGLYYAQPSQPSDMTSLSSLTHGLTMGYQTMDLMAAFFFSSTLVSYLRNHLAKEDGDKVLFKLSLKAILIGALILGLAYVGFVALGARYAPELLNVKPESILVVIAQRTLGDVALPVVGFTMAVACLATAVILTLLFVNFIQSDIAPGRVKEKQAIFITVGITFAMSLLGFSKICEILDMILQVAYPALIALAITNILNKTVGMKHGKGPFWITLAASCLFKFSHLVM